MLSMTQDYWQDEDTFDDDDDFTNMDPVENEDSEGNIDRAMTDINEGMDDDVMRLEPQTDEGRNLLIYLRSQRVPELPAKQIASLFDIEDDLRARPALIYTEALTGKLSIGDHIHERILRLRLGMREIQRLELVWTNPNEVEIFEFIRAVWHSFEQITCSNYDTALENTFGSIFNLRMSISFLVSDRLATHCNSPDTDMHEDENMMDVDFLGSSVACLNEDLDEGLDEQQDEDLDEDENDDLDEDEEEEEEEEDLDEEEESESEEDEGLEEDEDTDETAFVDLDRSSGEDTGEDFELDFEVDPDKTPNEDLDEAVRWIVNPGRPIVLP